MSLSRKLYHRHGFDSKEFLETYFSGKPEMVFREDTVTFPIQKIFNLLSSELKKGGSLIDFSIGAILHHVYLVGYLFKEITLLRVSERCVMELRKWLDAHGEAFDWSHIMPVMADLQGHCSDWEEKEMQLKSAIKQILRFDFTKENPTDPIVLPQADCVITAWILDTTSTNEDEYMATLRKNMKFVKPGGLLLLIATINGTYYKVGEDTMHIFQHDENYVKNAVTKEGFTVTHCEVLASTAQSHLTDYKGMSFVAARKNK